MPQKMTYAKKQGAEVYCLPGFSHTDLQPAKMPWDQRSSIHHSLFSTAPWISNGH